MGVNARLTPYLQLLPASQGRNIFSIFVLTFEALSKPPGPVLVVIYSKVLFHMRKRSCGSVEWFFDHKNQLCYISDWTCCVSGKCENVSVLLIHVFYAPNICSIVIADEVCSALKAALLKW